jgi:hypothetical protein
VRIIRTEVSCIQKKEGEQENETRTVMFTFIPQPWEFCAIVTITRSWHPDRGVTVRVTKHHRLTSSSFSLVMPLEPSSHAGMFCSSSCAQGLLSGDLLGWRSSSSSIMVNSRINYQKMSSWRYLMHIGRKLNYGPVMKTSGTVEMGGSSSHMSANIGDVLCFRRPSPLVYICTYSSLNTGL